MTGCDQVKLLLGPFEDGELEPHEMEDVALHIVACGVCKDALDDYRSLGVALRDCLPHPALNGFAASVLARIEETPQPFRLRWRSYLDTLGERVGAAATLVVAGAFVALLTAWLVTPYTHLLLHHSSNLNQVASAQNDSTTATQPTNTAAHDASFDQPQPSVVALSNDPTTTVIWLPNQP